MYRPCPKCKNPNHISAHTCPCGYQIIKTPESSPNLRSEQQWAITATAPRKQLDRETFTTEASNLPEQILPQSLAESPQEAQKRAIRAALVAEAADSDSGKTTNGGTGKITVKKSLVLVSFIIAVGVLAAVFGGFTDHIFDFDERQEKDRASLTDTNLAPDARQIAGNDPAAKNAINAKVVDVISGDTIRIADDNNQEYEIKLEGVDAPEIEQEFGREAQRNLFTLVFGKIVQIAGQRSGAGGILVGKVLVNGINVNLEQLKSGLVLHDKNVDVELSDSDRDAREETVTEKGDYGLWSAANPAAPRDFRRAAQSEQTKQTIISGEPNVFTDTPPKAKTTVQKTRNAAASRTASNETAFKPVIIKIPPSGVGKQPSPKVSTTIPASYERKTLIIVRSATARCGNGTLSYTTRSSKTCAGQGGVAEWFNNSTQPAKIRTRPRKYNPVPRGGGCYVIDGGKTVYLAGKLCNP